MLAFPEALKRFLLFQAIFLLYEQKKDSRSCLDYPMRREGLEPSRPKAVTGSLVLRVCQFRHFR